MVTPARLLGALLGAFLVLLAHGTAGGSTGTTEQAETNMEDRQ